MFDATEPQTLCTQLRNVLDRNHMESVSDVFPRVDHHMTELEFKRGLEADCHFSGPKEVLLKAFQLLDTCGSGRVGLVELDMWLGFKSIPNERTLRDEARKVLSEFAGGHAQPTDVVRAWAAWGKPKQQRELMRQATFTRRGESLNSAAMAAAVAAGSHGELSIDRTSFLKRARRHVCDDTLWFGGMRLRFKNILDRMQCDEEHNMSVTELCMWLDGTPLHRAPMDECDLGGFRSVSGGPSQLIISGKSPDKHVHRPNRSTPSAAKRWMKGLDLDDLKSIRAERDTSPQRGKLLAHPASRTFREDAATVASNSTPRPVGYPTRQQRPLSASVVRNARPKSAASEFSSMPPLFHSRVADRNPRSARRMQAATIAVGHSPRDLARSLVGQEEGAVLPLRAGTAEALQVVAQLPSPRSVKPPAEPTWMVQGLPRSFARTMRVPLR